MIKLSSCFNEAIINFLSNYFSLEYVLAFITAKLQINFLSLFTFYIVLISRILQHKCAENQDLEFCQSQPAD